MSERDHVSSTHIAWHAAANAVSVLIGPSTNSLSWPLVVSDETMSDRARAAMGERMAMFLRHNPGATAETLFRFACGAGFCSLDGGDWLAIPDAYRVAYALFAATSRTAEQALALERALAERAAREAAPPPVARAYLDARPEDRIDAQVDDPLARVSHAPPLAKKKSK